MSIPTSTHSKDTAKMQRFRYIYLSDCPPPRILLKEYRELFPKDKTVGAETLTKLSLAYVFMACDLDTDLSIYFFHCSFYSAIGAECFRYTKTILRQNPVTLQRHRQCIYSYSAYISTCKNP